MHVKLHLVEKIIKMSEAEDYNSSELDDKLLDENTVTTVDQVLKVKKKSLDPLIIPRIFLKFWL